VSCRRDSPFLGLAVGPGQEGVAKTALVHLGGSQTMNELGISTAGGASPIADRLLSLKQDSGRSGRF